MQKSFATVVRQVFSGTSSVELSAQEINAGNIDLSQQTEELIKDSVSEIDEAGQLGERGERNNPGAGVINAFSGQQFLQGNSLLSSKSIDFDGPLLN